MTIDKNLKIIVKLINGIISSAVSEIALNANPDNDKVLYTYNTLLRMRIADLRSLKKSVMKEVKTLSEEEIAMISDIRQKTSEKIMQFGEIELEMIWLEKRTNDLNKFKNDLKQELYQLQTSEKDLSDQLNPKYGEGTLNLDKKEFIPA